MKEAMHRKSSGGNMSAIGDLHTNDNGLKRLPGSWQGKGILITVGVLVSLSAFVNLDWSDYPLLFRKLGSYGPSQA